MCGQPQDEELQLDDEDELLLAAADSSASEALARSNAVNKGGISWSS